jgi:hypothetical protein
MHNGPMVDRETVTPPPSAPVERDLDAEHKRLITELADHPDAKVRILSHISTRQFELSERMTAMMQTMDKGFAEMKRQVNEGFRDLRDQVAKLDDGFTDIEERTEELERHRLNGSSSPTQ